MTAPRPAPAPRCHALIPCAGSGSRAGAAQPKQYQTLHGRPLALHTLAAFARVPHLAQVLIVTAPGDRTLAAHLPALAAAGGPALPDLHLQDCGGPSRAHSVLAGLRHLRATGAGDEDWVLVHDAARCLITPDLIERLIAACLPDATGGLLALPLPDTLKTAAPGGASSGNSESAPRASATLPREGKWLAQTPQMFRLGALTAALAAHEAGGFAGITDEASAIEAAGQRPLLVRGSARNFKVTWPEDFALAAALLAAPPESPR